MTKTIVLYAPDNFDFGKLSALGPLEGVRTVQAHETLSVIEAPNKKNKVHRSRKGGVSVVSSVMDHYTPQGIFLATHAQAWVHQCGYDLNSASPALTALKKGGYVKQIGQGKYQFVRPLAQGTDVRAIAAAKTA